MNNSTEVKCEKQKSLTEELIKSTRENSLLTKDLINDIKNKLNPILKREVPEDNDTIVNPNEEFVTELYSALEDQIIIILEINDMLRDIIKRIEI
jgi:hypothetical protein